MTLQQLFCIIACLQFRPYIAVNIISSPYNRLSCTVPPSVRLRLDCPPAWLMATGVTRFGPCGFPR